MYNSSEYILNKLPHNYSISDASIINTIVKAIASAIDEVQGNIDVIDNMIGVNTTTGIDIDKRWGNLLLLPRKSGEFDSEYINRLKTSIVSLSGGTKESLKYAIAVSMNINNNQSAMDNQIHVYDAWDCLESGIDKSFGSFVCVVDLDGAMFNYNSDIRTVLLDTINIIKAAGTNPQLILKNFRVMTYQDMELLLYSDLQDLRYNQMGTTT